MASSEERDLKLRVWLSLKREKYLLHDNIWVTLDKVANVDIAATTLTLNHFDLFTQQVSTVLQSKFR